MTNKEMIAKVRELKELKAMAAELAAEITAIEDTIKADHTDVYVLYTKPTESRRFTVA